MLSPHGRALAVAAAGLAGLGWLAGYPELLGLGLSCAALLGAGAVAVARRPRLEVLRTLGSGRIMAGDPAAGSLTIRNRGRRASPALRATELVAGRPVPIAIPPLPPGRTWTVRYALPAAARGVHAVGPLLIEQADPLRLVRRVLQQGQLDALSVYPLVHSYPWPLRPPSGGQQERTADARAGGDVGFATLREYVPGDDNRLIHWPSSARLGTLLVRERMSPDEPRRTVLLDTSAAGYAGCPDPAESFEDAVRVAASVAAAAQRRGQPVTVRCSSGASASGGGRRTGLAPVLDLLAGVLTGADDRGLAALGRIAPGRDDDALLIITGALPAPELLALVRHRYTHVLLVLVGPAGGTNPRVAAGIGLIRAATSADLADVPAAR